MHQIPLLLLLLLVTAAAPAEEEFLLPDQAFRISGQAAGADAVVVSWDITDGYYMYRSKFRFRSDTVGIELGTPRTPPGETRTDEFFGEVEIYRDRVDIQVPIKRQTGSGDILTLEATSQGCADAGLCYPPHKQTILLELPAMAAPAPATTAGAQAQPALGALTALNRSLGLGEEDDILDPEEAFQLSSELTGPNEVRLVWDIAPGTYLYQEKIALRLEDGTQIALGEYVLPEAVIKPDSVRPDGTVGDTAVYNNRIDLRVPLLRPSPEATTATLVVDFQGCAEIGICYPPMTQRIALALPATTEVSALPVVSAPTQAPADQPISEQDQIAATLAGGNLWAVVALFFGFGLLLAFTPCVFPMIPILSGIIAGQGPSITTRKAFTLSLVYVLAMAATYTVAGVLAGIFGANLQAAFQNIWILFTFALVFVALAMSMFGFYELQLPSSLQSKLAEISNRQQGGTLIGVAIMGLLSALIVGPCVAPPLAGALIFIGQTGDAVLGGLALFALSLGMGAPLIAIGTSAGKLLPRAGAWMDAVKAVFGVLMLAVAIWLIERVIPAAVAMALWALLLICSAVYMGALQQVPAGASGWSKLWKGLGLVLLAYGVLMLVGAAAGGKDTLQPLRGLAVGGGAAQAHAEFRRIKTVEDLDREVAAAAAAGQPVLLDFYADWCVACKELERYTFSDPTVIKEMGRFVLLQADVTANDEADKALLQGRFGLPGPPAIMIYDRTGQELRGYRLVGFKPAAEFAEHLRRAVP
ncbi:MAG: protein-disulfide reductase DsbD [Chromatiaceae bacterium]|jgi:thiol:disulfide interchange protein DsbD|nr:protein-disulfide reductase DsbD [Chromatiaceae bacterium]